MRGEEERIVSYEYDLSGNNTAVISPSGAVTKNEFDCFGNAVRTILPDGTENVFTYDLLGNVTSETNGAGETVFYTYDGLSRLTRTEASDGERVSIERAYYDFRGNTVKTLDANNNKTLYSYNERGFLDTVKQYENATDGQEISYAYDGEGNITKMSIGAIGGKQKHTYNYKLDAYGRMISETDPENGVATYEYDTEGNLVSLRNKNGVTTSYTYDGLGRVLKQTNTKSGTIDYTYNDFSEVVKMTDGTMSVLNKYNSFGEVIETIRDSSRETYIYDSEGRVTTHITKDKEMGEVKTAYTYDVLGRTTSIATGGGTEYLTYDNAGRIAKKTIDSLGTEKRYSYYQNGLLKSVHTYRNGELINTENSEYDLSGNKTLEETDGNVKRYAYDGLNRLKSIIEHNGDQTEYEFDSFGNIAKEYTLTPGDIKTKYYHYDNANRLLLMYDDKSSQEYTYDAEGNMLTKVSDAGGSSQTQNYVYDGYNRLTEFYSQNTEAQYTYNPEGLRESKTVNGNTTRFLYNDGNIIGEFMGDDYYIYHRGTELIGYTSFSGKTANYQQNSHGNVTALLGYDGTELKTYNYNAYGKEQAFTANPEGNQTILYQWKNETDSTHNPFRYCGEYMDAETGLIYLRNRYYDPSIGRFITEDPAKDGENWYVYCGGNPVMFVDPFGLNFIPLRSTVESLGGKVTWSSSTGVATAKLDNQTVHTYKGDKNGTFINKRGVMYVDESWLFAAFAKIVDLGNGWTGRIERNTSGGRYDKHVHIYKGDKSYAQNEDGSPHDGSTGGPNQKQIDKLKEKTGWDWKKKENEWLDKIELELGVNCNYITYPNGRKVTVYHKIIMGVPIYACPTTSDLKKYYTGPTIINQKNNVSGVTIPVVPIPEPVTVPVPGPALAPAF